MRFAFAIYFFLYRYLHLFKGFCFVSNYRDSCTGLGRASGVEPYAGSEMQ